MENTSESSVAAKDVAQRPAPPDTLGSHYSTHDEHVTKHFGFFHPTQAYFFPPGHKHTKGDTPAPGEAAQWNSRASRKNRFNSDAIHVRHHHTGEAESASELGFVVLGSGHFRAWVFCMVNGFVLFLPLVDIGGDHASAASWWAFVGGTLFEIGSYLMLVESLNTGHDQLFGPALWGIVSRASLNPSSSDETLTPEKGTPKFRWIGWGSPRDLGYLACTIQMFAASIFWVSTITGIPGVIPNLPTTPPTAISDVFFWTPQVIGGIGFIVSSVLLMLEVQKKWWLPNLTSIGWHIAFWNVLGAFGFTLCGALGYGSVASTKVDYQSVLSTFWGSFGFEIGSVIQLWETLWREDPDAGEDSGKPT
ncbi:hypothetical protein EUX98_g9670 [Antrodiella citrinella]|uniref:Integral membrane protein n=1 Tax=Antrodiella citrinella TaxID=2447956 RepID=A0A4S4LNX0_9APHY|nr:hypothetical protein EUX98_g9670 [Antrodiella citrinella]